MVTKITKTLASQIADLDARQGIVVHYWSSYGNTDSDGDVIERGAYDKSLAQWEAEGATRIKFLWQHDVHEPIGVPLQLWEDPNGPGPDGGLRAVTKISPTARGRDALILYDEGVLSEHSVGIEIRRRSASDRARVVEAHLWEGSVVTWGANPLTPFVGMKGALAALSGEDAARRVEKALTRPLTDETAAELERWLDDYERQATEAEILRRLINAL